MPKHFVKHTRSRDILHNTIWLDCEPGEKLRN